MAKINKVVRQSFEMAACIKAISEKLPAIRESEIVWHAYAQMAADFKSRKIDGSIWDELVKTKFDDALFEYPDIKGISFDDADYDIVVTGYDTPNSWCYLSQESVHRAPTPFVTKLVLYYFRKTLENDKTKVEPIEINAAKLIADVVAKTYRLITDGKTDLVLKFLELGDEQNEFT